MTENTHKPHCGNSFVYICFVISSLRLSSYYLRKRERESAKFILLGKKKNLFY